MKLGNESNIPMALAVWLIHDDYDYVHDPNYLSATSIMKPLKQIILAERVPEDAQVGDVQDYISRALGNSIHAGVEKAWLSNPTEALLKLGIPEAVARRIIINPTEVQLRITKDAIPVYIEQRSRRNLDGMWIGGKYDLVMDGVLNDTKSTSVWSYIKGNRTEEHQLQGSIYRWLNPEKITEDFIRINYVFTDWQKSQVQSIQGYPQSRIVSKDIPLLSIEETEAWLKSKIAQIRKYRTAHQQTIPNCTNEELWIGESQYKYYSDPTKTDGRATKNFGNDKAAAYQYKAEKGKGVVIEITGTAKRCSYCAAYPICEQRELLGV